MSRAIKFRAWSNEHNRYCDLIKMDEDDRWYGYIYSCAVYLSTKDIVLEQYTGLKDKNGKEIYEGDILGGIFEGCYIGWCDITKSFELFNCYERYCMACDGDILWCELSDSDIDLEVIGNIHEDKELIDGSD